MTMDTETSVQTVFFDAVGTLFTVKGSVGQVYSRVARDFGVEVDSVHLNRAFYHAFQQAPAAAFPGVAPEQVANLERQWWRQVVEQTFAAVGYGDFCGFDAYFTHVYDLFAEAGVWELYPETLDVLQQIQRAGIPMGLISNFDSRLFPVIAALGLRDYFASITSSSSVGAAKPDPLIFAAALAKHGIAAPAALHIGDSFSQDYQGARAVGWQALWLNREGNRTPHSDEIFHLEGVLPRLAVTFAFS
ncbi:MAG: HAD family hydrolase [Synechococcales cyanobacterium]